MWMITDDPIRDLARHEAEQERARAKLPRCCECGEHITDDECYDFDGDLICPNCLKENHRIFTEDLVE